MLTHLLALVLKTKQNMILSFNFWCQFGAFCQSIIASLLAHKSLFTRLKFPIQQNEYSDPSWLQKYTDKLNIVITMLKAKTALLFKQDRFSWLFRVCTLQRKVIIVKFPHPEPNQNDLATNKNQCWPLSLVNCMPFDETLYPSRQVTNTICFFKIKKYRIHTF